MMLVISNAQATAQYPDVIFYKGKKYGLYTNPMEPYFTKYPDKKPKTESQSTALWRGYVATFEFKDKELILKDIEIETFIKKEDGEIDFEFRSVKSQVVSEGKVLSIDWFTGILVLPYGELVNYVHMGYGSTYEKYILLEVGKGRLTDVRNLSHKEYEQFKDKQFQAFKKTEEYKKHIAELKKEDGSQEDIDSFLRNFVVNYTSEFFDGDKKPFQEKR